MEVIGAGAWIESTISVKGFEEKREELDDELHVPLVAIYGSLKLATEKW